MKTRLVIFICSLLLLPPAGLWLSGNEWGALSSGGMAENVNTPAVLLTTLLFAGYILFINHLIKLLTGNSPLNLQRDYFVWISATSAVLGWLLVYLNLFVASWVTQPENLIMQSLLYTPLFALLGPAVLITRALLGSFGGLLKFLSRGIPLSRFRNESLVLGLAPLAVLGLTGGAAWPEKLFWLLWLAPLLLLAALQLLWGESTIFSGLKSGDWGRLICAALAGLIVGNFVVFAYQNNGGIIDLTLPIPFFAQLGYATFGLLCLQLSDVVAENWRGKRQPKSPRKIFPIPVVVKPTSSNKADHV